MLAILCKPQDKHGKEDQKNPFSMIKPTPTAPPSALPSKPSQYPKHPNGCFPLQQIMVERGPIYVLFQLLDSYTEAQTNTFKPLSL
jgi:hypothetical protein